MKSGLKFSEEAQANVQLVRSLLAKNLVVEVMARGHSMEPFLRAGDLVGIQPLSGTAPRVGEIVAYIGKSSGKAHIVIHRVVAFDATQGQLLAKGDNLKVYDHWVSNEDVLGKVVYTKIGTRTKRVVFSRNPALLFYRYLVAHWAQTHRDTEQPDLVLPLRGVCAICCDYTLRLAWWLSNPGKGNCRVKP